MEGHQPKAQETVLRLLLEQRANLFSFITALVRDLSLAEEIFQEVAVVVCEQWRDFTPGSDFGAWTRTIARNKVYTHNRNKARAPFLLPPEALDNLELAASVDDAATQQEMTRALQDCLEQLGGRARQMIALRYQDNLPCEQVAQESGCSVSAVYMLLSRLRARLADCVDGRISRKASK